MVSLISMVAKVSVVGLSLPLTIVVSVAMVSNMAVSVVAITMVVMITIARLSLPLTVVEPVSVVSYMTVSMDESVVSVVSVVSVRRGFCLGFSLAEDCSHQEESEEHNGLHICGCEQAR